MHGQQQKTLKQKEHKLAVTYAHMDQSNNSKTIGKNLSQTLKKKKRK